MVDRAEEGFLPFHVDAVIGAAVQAAQRHADLLGAYLRASDLTDGGELRLPAAAILELAAVLQIGLWEQHGLRPHMEVDLPTYREAADQLAARCLQGPAEFQGSGAAPLSIRVFQVRVEHLAWAAPELLGADVVLGGVDDDFIDLLAEFVWRNRRELTQLIRQNEVRKNET